MGFKRKDFDITWSIIKHSIQLYGRIKDVTYVTQVYKFVAKHDKQLILVLIKTLRRKNIELFVQ